MTIHEQLAKDHRMLGMVINAEITAPSLACFVRGSHVSGTFVELLLHNQFETAQKSNPEKNFWIFHGAVYRCAWGHCTAGEFVDPSTGIRLELPDDCDMNQEVCIKQHPSPLATTFETPDEYIIEVDGDKVVETCEIIKPSTGADAYDVCRLALAEVRVAVFHVSAYAWQHAYIEACTRWINFISSAIAHFAD